MKTALQLGPTVGKGIEGPLSNQKTASPFTGFGDTVNALVTAAFVIAGLVFVIYFIMGAFTYITAAGDEKLLEKAKKTMWDAVLGFVILSLTFLVIDVLSGILGFSILSFSFSGL
jgi:hypothetical protein